MSNRLLSLGSILIFQHHSGLWMQIAVGHNRIKVTSLFYSDQSSWERIFDLFWCTVLLNRKKAFWKCLSDDKRFAIWWEIVTARVTAAMECRSSNALCGAAASSLHLSCDQCCECGCTEAARETVSLGTWMGMVLAAVWLAIHSWFSRSRMVNWYTNSLLCYTYYSVVSQTLFSTKYSYSKNLSLTKASLDFLGNSG